MYQLIYTSAPKLLEAGKTGFGTIARSRDLPQPLVMYLERISTLDRQAGISGYETYCSYKLGREVFHIFSHIADCGADYTGRTNHLAQHFIVEDGSAEFSMLGNSTPAGVLLGLRGILLDKAWSGGPTWLPETQAPVNPMTVSAGAWLRYTGNQDNAKWLNTYGFASGACLRGDAGIGDFVPLLHDAFLERSDRGWGVGFSTVCASNISIQRFPMLCLGEEQARARVSVPRGIPELTVNGSLTPPPENELIMERQAPVQGPSQPAPVPSPQVAPVVVQPVPPVDMPLPTAGAGGCSPLPRPCEKGKGRGEKRSNNYLPAVLIGLVVAFMVYFLIGEKQEKPESKAPVAQGKPTQPAPTDKTEQKSKPDAKQEQPITPSGKQGSTPAAQGTDKPKPAAPTAEQNENAEKQLKDNVEKAKKQLMEPIREKIKDVNVIKGAEKLLDGLFSTVKSDSDLKKAEGDAPAQILAYLKKDVSDSEKSLVKRGDELKNQLDPFVNATGKKSKVTELMGKLEGGAADTCDDMFERYQQIKDVQDGLASIDKWLLQEQSRAKADAEGGYIKELDGVVLCTLPVEVYICEGKERKKLDFRKHVSKEAKGMKFPDLTMNVEIEVTPIQDEKLIEKIKRKIREKHPKADEQPIPVKTENSPLKEQLTIPKIGSMSKMAADLFSKYSIKYNGNWISDKEWDKKKKELDVAFNKICQQRDKAVKKEIPQDFVDLIKKIRGLETTAEELRADKTWNQIKEALRKEKDEVIRLRGEVVRTMSERNPLDKYECQLIIHIDKEHAQRVMPEYKIVKKKGK